MDAYKIFDIEQRYLTNVGKKSLTHQDIESYIEFIKTSTSNYPKWQKTSIILSEMYKIKQKLGKFFHYKNVEKMKDVYYYKIHDKARIINLYETDSIRILMNNSLIMGWFKFDLLETLASMYFDHGYRFVEGNRRNKDRLRFEYIVFQLPITGMLYAMNLLFGELIPLKVSMETRFSETMFDLLRDDTFIIPINRTKYLKYVNPDYENDLHLFKNQTLGSKHNIYNLYIEWYSSDGVFKNCNKKMIETYVCDCMGAKSNATKQLNKNQFIQSTNRYCDDGSVSTSICNKAKLW